MGGIGTPTNRIHFKSIEARISRLAQKLDFQIIVVGLSRKLNWRAANISYLPWELTKGIDFFGLFDIRTTRRSLI